MNPIEPAVWRPLPDWHERWRVAARVAGIVLAGGTAARMDGVDKAAIEVGGRTLLERALAVLTGLETVVVGDEVPTSRPVTFRRENPVGGGPAAAVMAGIAGFATHPTAVLVLAVDMPGVTRATLDRLLAAASGHDGALLVDRSDRRQYLCAAYDVAALTTRGATLDLPGLAVRRLVDGLDLAEVPAVGREAEDVDTWADLARVRESEAPPDRE